MAGRARLPGPARPAPSPACLLREDGPVRLLLFGHSGFTGDFRAEAAAAPDVELVDLERLYLGD